MTFDGLVGVFCPTELRSISRAHGSKSPSSFCLVVVYELSSVRRLSQRAPQNSPRRKRFTPDVNRLNRRWRREGPRWTMDLHLPRIGSGVYVRRRHAAHLCHSVTLLSLRLCPYKWACAMELSICRPLRSTGKKDRPGRTHPSTKHWSRATTNSGIAGIIRYLPNTTLLSHVAGHAPSSCMQTAASNYSALAACAKVPQLQAPSAQTHKTPGCTSLGLQGLSPRGSGAPILLAVRHPRTIQTLRGPVPATRFAVLPVGGKQFAFAFTNSFYILTSAVICISSSRTPSGASSCAVISRPIGGCSTAFLAVRCRVPERPPR